jgi:hypothetical protein
MPVGGYGSARVEHFRYHEIISFQAGYTQVMGTTRMEGTTTVYDTMSSSVIEKLNILDVITADRVVARLTSETRVEAGAPVAPGTLELNALPAGSYFENLRILGQPISPKCHPQLLDPRYGTRSAIADGKLPLYNADATDTRNTVTPARDGTLRFCLFQPLETEVAGTIVFPGLRITLPTFGDLFLGEFIVSGTHRQLTMIRLELHSPEEGNVAFGSVEGNGSGY